MDVVNDVLQQTLLLVLFTGGVLGLLTGLLLLFRPGTLERLNNYFSRWISVAWLQQGLDRPRDMERFFHRHQRKLGGILLVYAAAGLYLFLTSRIYRLAMQSSDGLLTAALANLFLLSLVLAAAAGAALLLCPGLLGTFERTANRWTSTDGFLHWLEVERPPLDRQVLRHRFPAGLLITVCSLYVLIRIGYFLAAGGLF